MATKNYGALRILTKDKLSIISVDPKDITASDNYVYAYPRNHSLRDTGPALRIVLGEYEDEVYAKEVIQLIFTALSNDNSTFEMPDEEALDEYEDKIKKRACLGAEKIIKADLKYTTGSEINDDGEEVIYTEGKMTVIDNNTEVYLTIRNPGIYHEYDFTVSKSNKRKRVQSCYHTFHELLMSRYGAFLASMYRESGERNKVAINAARTAKEQKGKG